MAEARASAISSPEYELSVRMTIHNPNARYHAVVFAAKVSVALSCQRHPGPSVQELKKVVCPS